MVLLPAVDLPYFGVAQFQVDHRHWSKQRQHHRCRGHGGFPFIPLHTLMMALQVLPNLPLDQGVHEKPDHGQQR